MKKTLFAFAAVVAALVSCQKEIQNPVSASNQELEARDCFVASLDQSTKTILGDSLQVKWAADDSIIVNGVVYGLDFIYEDSDSTRAEFSKRYKDQETPKAPFVAFFPAKWYDADQNNIVVPKTIERKENGDFSMPMKAVSNTRTMTFVNTYGVLAVKVEKSVLSEAVNTITVKTSETDTARVLVCSPAQTISENGNIFYVPMAEANYDSLLVFANSHEMFSRNNKDIEIKAGSLYAFNYRVSLKGIKIEDSITDTVYISPGADTTFTVIYDPTNATVKDVNWEISDSTIATVDAGGKITGVSPDTVTVTVTSKEGGYTDSRVVIVKIPVTSVQIDTNSVALEEVKLYIGDSIVLNAIVKPDSATCREVTWAFENPQAVTFDATSGKLKAAAEDTTYIYATADGITDTCTLIVFDPSPKSVKLSCDTLSISCGTENSFTWTFENKYACDTVVYFTQSDKTGLLVLNNSGKFQSNSSNKYGKTIVYVTVENHEDVKDSVIVFVCPTYSDNASYSGLGILVGNTWWAPVNCGYEPATSEYKGYIYGKLYQWGRKYGQGYCKGTYEDADYPGKAGGVQTFENVVKFGKSLTSHKDEETKFYSATMDWYEGTNPAATALWGATRTDHDPCPEGWRVPTEAELTALIGSAKDIRDTKTDGIHGTSTDINGLYYNGTSEQDPKSGVFLPFAGSLSTNCAANYRGTVGSYWSSLSTYSYTSYTGKNLNVQSAKAGISSTGTANGYSVRCVR